MSQQVLPCTPPPKHDREWVHFFLHGCLVPPIFFPKKSGFCRRYEKLKPIKRVFVFFFTKMQFSPTSHYMIHISDIPFERSHRGAHFTV